MAKHLQTISVSRPPFLGSGTWSISNLNDITIIFGKNGVGKSILLRNLRDQSKDIYHYTSPERAGEINYNPSYMQEEASGQTRASRSASNLAPTYRESTIARIQTFLAKRGNIRKSSIDEDPGNIEDMLQVLMPEFIFKIKDGSFCSLFYLFGGMSKNYQTGRRDVKRATLNNKVEYAASSTHVANESLKNGEHIVRRVGWIRRHIRPIEKYSYE